MLGSLISAIEIFPQLSKLQLFKVRFVCQTCEICILSAVNVIVPVYCCVNKIPAYCCVHEKCLRTSSG